MLFEFYNPNYTRHAKSIGVEKGVKLLWQPLSKANLTQMKIAQSSTCAIEHNSKLDANTQMNIPL